jgi:hypothetical protein
MKKHKSIVLGIFCIALLIPALSYAIGGIPVRPFGGSIISTPSDNSATIVCTAAYGPFFIKPVSPTFPAGPYFIQITNKGTPKRLGWILGNYELIPDAKTCVNPETGAPIPSFKVKLYGVSK